jgi:hypothetical protein
MLFFYQSRNNDRETDVFIINTVGERQSHSPALTLKNQSVFVFQSFAADKGMLIIDP